MTTTVVQYLTHLEQYAESDRRALDALPTGPLYGKCGVPTALLGFSILDTLGFLVSGKRLDEGMSDNIKALLNPNRGLPSAARLFQFTEVLITIFRNAIVHRFYPRGSGIARGLRTDPAIADINGQYVLNPDAVLDTAISMITELRNQVVNGRLPGDISADLIEARINALMANDRMMLLIAKNRASVVSSPQGTSGTTTTPPMTAWP